MQAFIADSAGVRTWVPDGILDAWASDVNNSNDVIVWGVTFEHLFRGGVPQVR
jgi:hypothetical protein